MLKRKEMLKFCINSSEYFFRNLLLKTEYYITLVHVLRVSTYTCNISPLATWKNTKCVSKMDVQMATDGNRGSQKRSYYLKTQSMPA